MLGRVLPHKAHDGSKLLGEINPNSSKIKSVISMKAHKNAEVYNSAIQGENKEIADFNLRKSKAIFANR